MGKNDDIKTVVVRAPNWLGDAVMSLPFFASLRATLPGATIICSCRPSLTSLFNSVESIDRVIPLDESKGRSGLSSVRLNAAHLRKLDAGCAISLPTSFGAALMFWLARIPRRIGHAADGRGLLLTDSLPFGSNGRRPHRSEGYLSLLALLASAPIINRELLFAPSAAAVEKAERAWAEANLDSTVLILGPGAAQPNKMWSPQKYAEIAQRWIAEKHGGVALIGSPSERDLCDVIKTATGDDTVANLAGKGDIAVAAGLIRRAEMFIGNDSGLAHLAAAVGTKTIVISGPGDPTEVAPFSSSAVTVKHPLFCSPCYKNSCWRKDKPLECLTEIQIDQVWQHVLRHIAA